MIIYNEEEHIATCPHCGWWHRAGTYEIGEKLIKQHQEGTMPDFPRCTIKLEGD